MYAAFDIEDDVFEVWLIGVNDSETDGIEARLAQEFENLVEALLRWNAICERKLELL